MKTALALALAAAILSPLPAAAQRRLVNQYNEQLKRLSSQQQRAVLRRAVLDSGLRCARIGTVGYQGPYRNLEMWAVNCGSSGNYAAFVGLDQSVQVRPCGDMAKLKLPLCRALPPSPPQRRL